MNSKNFRNISRRDFMKVAAATTATPLTNIRYTGNPEGAIYGYEQSMDNAYMTRLDQRTPFKGLYLASAWTKPGGGYQPCLGSGADAFKALVKDLANI